MFLPLINAALDGCLFTLNKVLLQYAPPIFITSWRFLLAGILFLAYLLFTNHSSLKVSKAAFIKIIKIAVLTLVANGLRVWCIKLLSPTKVALLANIAPFISYGLAVFFLAEKVTPKRIMGLVIGFSSCMPVILAESANTATQNAPLISWPEVGAFVSIFCFCYVTMMTQELLVKERVSILTNNALNMLLAGAIALPISYVYEPVETVNCTHTFLIGMAFLILIGNIICATLTGWILKKHSITLIAFAALTSPLAAALSDLIYFGEPIKWTFFASAALIALGLAVFFHKGKNTPTGTPILAEAQPS